jgi:hypothetical protein
MAVPHHSRNLYKVLRTIRKRLEPVFLYYLNGPSMSASQVNANDWSFLSPELVLQMMISVQIIAGTLAVRSSLFPYSFFPGYVVFNGG